MLTRSAVLFPLAWCGALLRLGRLDKALRHIWRSSNKHRYSDDVMGWRNCVSYDGHIAADIVLPAFIEKFGVVDERHRRTKCSLSKYKDLVEEAFGRGSSECKSLIENDDIRCLLNARSTVWGKIHLEQRGTLLGKIDELIEQSKIAVAKALTVDPFSKDSLLASDVRRILSEVERRVANCKYLIDVEYWPAKFAGRERQFGSFRVDNLHFWDERFSSLNVEMN